TSQQTPSEENVTRGILRNALYNLAARPAKPFRPEVSAARRILGQENVVTARTGQESTSEIHGTLEYSSNQNVPTAICGYHAAEISARTTKTLGPGARGGCVCKVGNQVPIGVDREGIIWRGA